MSWPHPFRLGQFYPAPSGPGTLSADPDYIPAFDQVTLNVGAFAEIWTGISPNSSGHFDNHIIGTYDVVAGTVNVDRNSAVRRTCTGVILAPNEIGPPDVFNPSGIQSPYGHELRLYRQVTEVGGTIQVVSMGVFMIETVQVDDGSAGIFTTLSGSDRAAWVSRRGFTRPFGIAGGMYTADVAIQLILLEVCQTLATPFVINAYASTLVVPTLTFAIGADPWAECQKIAAADGCELFFDPIDGTCWYVQIPYWFVDVLPCIDYYESVTQQLVTVKRNLSNTTTPNVIAMSSQGTGVASPSTVYWWDSDSSSPTYYAPPPGGGFGTPQYVLPSLGSGSHYPLCVSAQSTAVATTPAALQQMANVAGQLAVGALERTTFSLRDQPAHDVDDVFGALRTADGITLSLWAVDSIQFDLGIKGTTDVTARPIGIL